MPKLSFHMFARREWQAAAIVYTFTHLTSQTKSVVRLFNVYLCIFSVNIDCILRDIQLNWTIIYWLALVLAIAMEESRTCTDTFGFGEQDIFALIRKTLPNDRSRTLNIIECKDDVVFAWSASDCCVLSLNWRAAKSKNDGSIKCQVGGTFSQWCMYFRGGGNNDTGGSGFTALLLQLDKHSALLRGVYEYQW